jgi:hypothetical protein
MAIAGLLLSDGDVGGRWVIARPKPRTRTEKTQKRVVAVRLPRSAEQRPGRNAERKGKPLPRSVVRKGRRTA